MGLAPYGRVDEELRQMLAPVLSVERGRLKRGGDY